MPIAEGPMIDAESAKMLRTLLDKGVLGGAVLDTDDCHKDYEELEARGVKFVREPKEMPYGIEALFRDDSNNFYSLTERRR